MAKDNSMVEVKEGQIVDLQVHIDKDDVLAIGLVEFEELCERRVAEAREQAAEHRKRQSELSGKLANLLQKHAEEVSAEAIKDLTAAFKKLGVKKPDFAVRAGRLLEKEKDKDKGQSLEVHLSANDPKRDYERQFSFSHVGFVKPPAEAQKLQEQVSQAGQAAAECDQEALQWKSRLTKIGRYERKLRAEIARANLSKSDIGQEMIAAMLGDIEGRVLSLPGR